MPASFTFYGVVEDDQPGSPEVGRGWNAQAYGYTEGQKIAGRLVLTAEGTDAYLDLQDEEAQAWTPNGYIADFHFERDAVGGFTEADIPPTGSFLLGANGTDVSITEFFLGGGRENANGVRIHRFEADQAEHGGVRLLDRASGDYGPAVVISGAWLPEGITPHLVYGTDAADVLRGRGEVSMLWGGLGDDTLIIREGGFAWGGQGGDTIRGGEEEDQVWGGLGADSIQGRDGADLLYGQWGGDTIHGGGGDDTIDGGRASEDSDGLDLLQGGSGEDLLLGHLGSADTLLGGADDDVIHSGSGVATYQLAFASGEGGDDLLVAQHGWARLNGGRGEDVFQVRSLDQVVIEDFKPRLDRLDFADLPRWDDSGELYYEWNPQWDTFAELMGRASQQGADVVFQFYAGSNTVTLKNVQLSQLTSADFIF